ncbi:MAG: PaaI family thioesterase [Pseudomonadales bacterium]|nr:PaaI family thioesterase [Pseudomonadales bacterium]
MSADLLSLIEQCRQDNDYDPLISKVPYAELIGVRCFATGEEMIFHLPPKESNIGNPTLPAIHGGVLGGFVEHSALLYVLLRMEEPSFPKIIDLSIDYLSAGHYKDTYAECKILRMGRRLANVSVTVWQTKKEQPVCTARAHLLLG